MKTQQEIEQLAKSKFITHKNISLSESNKTMCRRSAFIKGYTQCQEDMADKKYTEEDLIKYIREYSHLLLDSIMDKNLPTPEKLPLVETFIKNTQPKTEWEVEIVDGKLKLK